MAETFGEATTVGPSKGKKLTQAQLDAPAQTRNLIGNGMPTTKSTVSSRLSASNEAAKAKQADLRSQVSGIQAEKGRITHAFEQGDRSEFKSGGSILAQQRAFDAQMSGLNSQISAGDAIQKQHGDIKRGVEFGESVLGEEGLGRLGDDADIQGALERTKRESEQGLSSAEYVASRERANQGIDQATQGASRGLLARLQQAGVKGASAGSQLAGVEVGGMKAKANVERDIFLKSADVQRQSFSDFKQSLGDVKSFDLGQQARETDIVLQAGLGFAGMGSAEKIAKLQGDAQAQAAAARSSANSCWAAGSLVMMMDGSVKAIEQIKLGEMTRHGQVEGRTQHLVPNSIMVKVDGIQVVGSHPIKELETWIESKDSVLAVTKLETAKDIIVYDLITTMNRVEIRGESGFPYLFTDYNGHDMQDENDRLLEELNNAERTKEVRK